MKAIRTEAPALTGQQQVDAISVKITDVERQITAIENRTSTLAALRTAAAEQAISGDAQARKRCRELDDEIHDLASVDGDTLTARLTQLRARLVAARELATAEARAEWARQHEAMLRSVVADVVAAMGELFEVAERLVPILDQFENRGRNVLFEYRSDVSRLGLWAELKDAQFSLRERHANIDEIASALTGNWQAILGRFFEFSNPHPPMILRSNVVPMFVAVKPPDVA